MGILVYALTAAVYVPLLVWLEQRTLSSDQLKHALIILGFGAVLLAYERRATLWPPACALDNVAVALLCGSYGLTALSYLHPLFLLPALPFALASGARWLAGPRAGRLVFAVAGAFALYLVFLLALPFADWPLRLLAGEWAAKVLHLFGRDVQLGVLQEAQTKLMLLVDGRPFEVAAECNGFGVLGASLLLALLLGLNRRMQVGALSAFLGLATVAAFLMNVLRIVAIVLLAPLVKDQYLLMHEVVGVVFFYGALGFVVWVGFKPRSGVASAPAQQEGADGTAS